MNYFELYPGDYLKATQRLTLLEHGAYLRLLMAYYGEEEPLPADLGELFVTVSAISAADKAAVRKVADRFFPVAADGLRHNDRADAEIEKAQRRIAAAKANGSKGGRKSKANANPTETQRVSQWDTQPLTQSGEALHAPHATEKPSDPDGSGADAPVDPIWGSGLSFLIRRGIPQKQARSLLGKLRQAAGDVQTGALLADCEAQDITDPAPWLMAAAARARAGPRADAPSKRTIGLAGFLGVDPHDLQNDNAARAVVQGVGRAVPGDFVPAGPRRLSSG